MQKILDILSKSLYFLIIIQIHNIRVKATFYCLSCDDAVQPRHCDYVQPCNEGQKCFVEKYTALNGEDRFNMGCKDVDRCKSTMRRDISERTIDHQVYNFTCSECCDSDLCNAKGCGEQGYLKVRGPICFTCHQQLDQASCRKISYCARNELCYLSERVEFGDKITSSGCISSSACTPYDQNPNIIGKRSISHLQKRTYPRDCCSHDLCNDRTSDCNWRMYWNENPLVNVTASSTHPHCGVRNAVLGLTEGILAGQYHWAPAWCASTNINYTDYVQFDFSTSTLLNGIILQGRHDSDQWVTKFRIEYSDDCLTWTKLPTEFVGNNDRNMLKVNMFSPSLTTRCIRVNPTAWNGWPSFRIDFVGCLQ